jgi:hypothetical protein
MQRISGDWLLLWAMPNVTVQEPIASAEIGIFPPRSAVVRSAVERHPTLAVYLKEFRDKFGQLIAAAR